VSKNDEYFFVGDCDHTKNKIDDDLHIDYRLRVATKRTDLPEDVLLLIGEAYAEIVHLNRQLNEIQKQLGKYTLDEIARLDEELGLNGD